MKRVITSTGGLIGWPNKRDYTLLKDCLPRIRADGVEFMLYDTWYPEMDRLTDTLLSIPVKYTGLHVEKSIGEYITEGNYDEAKRLFQINCDFARKLGCEHMVLHLWNGLPSDSHMENNIAYYATLKKMAEDTGIPLSVENVLCNCHEPIQHMFALLERYPDIIFTFDTKMAQFHRQMDRMMSPECAPLWPHIRHLHINDYNGGYLDFSQIRTLHIGDGEIDFDRFFAFLKQVDYDGDLVVEAVTWDENGVIHPEKMNITLDKIRRYIGKQQ